MPTVLLVPDCGPAIGSGHLDRSLALAEELSEISVTIALPQDPQVQARAHGRRVTSFAGSADLAERVMDAAAQTHPDVIVLDGYMFPVALESAMREHSRVVVIDDLNGPCDVDLLVNPAPGAEAIAVPKGAREVLAGPRYALMARAYEGARKARERKPLEGLPRLLAVSGGADIGGLIAYLVAALMPLLDRAYLDAVVGPHGTALTAVDGVTIHDAPECLDNLLGAAGVYVGAAGTTAVQAAAVGVAQVILPLVDNQVAQAAALEHAGAAIAIERRDADLAKVATKMADATALILGDAARMREMGMNGARLVDGLGAARVAEAVRRLATLGAVA